MELIGRSPNLVMAPRLGRGTIPVQIRGVRPPTTTQDIKETGRGRRDVSGSRCSSEAEHSLGKGEVVGSNPTTGSIIRCWGVVGSNPTSSSIQMMPG